MLALLVTVILIAAIISLFYNAAIGVMPGGLLGLLALVLVIYMLTR